MVNPKKRAKFLRENAHSYVRLGMKWRKARGSTSKVRRNEKGKTHKPSPGFGAPRLLRFLHPSGKKEILIFNLHDLEKINSQTEAARIAHSVGKKKKQEILKKADEIKIAVLNK